MKRQEEIERVKRAGLDATYYFVVYNAIDQLEKLIDDPNHCSAEKLDKVENYIREIQKYHKDEIVAFQEEKVQIPLNVYGRTK